jgi:hypothetical protein
MHRSVRVDTHSDEVCAEDLKTCQPFGLSRHILLEMVIILSAPRGVTQDIVGFAYSGEGSPESSKLFARSGVSQIIEGPSQRYYRLVICRSDVSRAGADIDVEDCVVCVGQFESFEQSDRFA